MNAYSSSRAEMPHWRERVARLNDRLLPQLPGLLARWLPNGRLAGAEWTALNPLRHDDRAGSFRVNVRSGRWADFATGDRGGDPVSLYAYLFTAGRQGVAARALEQGIGAFWTETPAKAAKAAKAREPDGGEARRLSRARAIYASAVPLGGPARRYLRNRKLSPCLAWTGLREVRLRYPGGGWYPALIAQVTGTDDTISGIQRTFLTADGRKLDVPDPKLSLGPVRGGAIRLAEPGEELTLCEGLEDGLSLAQELPDARVWAAPGAGMLAALMLPNSVARVIIAADNDAAGEQAANRAAERFAREGRAVRIMRPDPCFKDWNDQLRGIGR